MGLVYTQLDRLDEAQAAYDEALVHCDAVGDSTHRLLALDQLDGPLAGARRHRARRSAVRHRAARGDGRRATSARSARRTSTSASSRARAATLDDAERHFGTAYDNAMRREDLLLAAETSREQAELYEIDGQESRDAASAVAVAPTVLHEASRAAQPRRSQEAHRPARDALLRHRHAVGAQRSNRRTRTRSATASASPTTRARWRATWGYDEITMFWFRIGALLHDVGKIVGAIRDLEQARPVDAPKSARSWRRTPPPGSDLLRDIDFPWDILPLVRGHHERWDGTRLSGQARRRRHRDQRAHRLRRRRVRRADDRPSVSPRRSRGTKR